MFAIDHAVAGRELRRGYLDAAFHSCGMFD